MTRSKTVRRLGFSLIELMVVIIIIAVLMALLLPALSRSIRYAQQVSTQTEIRQLDAALQSFEAKFGVPYVPSQIKLCKFYADYLNNTAGTSFGSPLTQLDSDSIYYMTKLFPKLRTTYTSGSTTIYGAWSTTINTSTSTITNNGTGVNWTQDSSWTSVTTYPATGTVPRGPFTILEGHQALAFFLGGIQTNTTPSAGNTIYGCTGFSTNPLNPSDTTSTIDRIPLFFEFTPARLSPVLSNSNSLFSSTPLTKAVFVSYHDSLGKQPFAYFSGYFKPDGYSRSAPTYTGYGTKGDNPTLGVMPYYINGTSSPTQYLNPDTFQILCAGADGQFNSADSGLTFPGIAWSPDGSLATGTGADDLTNFTSGLLKAGQ
jgi:general secretion pathway protein G